MPLEVTCAVQPFPDHCFAHIQHNGQDKIVICWHLSFLKWLRKGEAFARQLTKTEKPCNLLHGALEICFVFLNACKLQCHSKYILGYNEYELISVIRDNSAQELSDVSTLTNFHTFSILSITRGNPDANKFYSISTKLLVLQGMCKV